MVTETTNDGPGTRTLIGINAGIALAHVGNYIWFPILIAVLGGETSGFWAGFVMFMTYVGRLSATFFYEGVAARIGTRASVVAAVLVEAVGLLLMGFTEGVAVYSVLAFFIGFGSGISFPGLKNILSSFPEAQRPKAFSTFQMACQVGAFAGALAGGVFAGFDLRVVFSVVFALFLAYALAALVVIPEWLDPSARTAPRPPLFNTAVITGLRSSGAGARYFLLSSVFWFMSISFLVGIPLHMQDNVPEWPVSVPFWITGVLLLLLQVPTFGFLIKRLAPGHVMTLAFVSMAIAYTAFGVGRSAVWVVVGCAVVVFGDILFTPAFDMWVSTRMSKDELARAMGSMHFFRSFGNMVGTLVAGALYDLSHRADVPGLNWYVVGVVAVLCAVFAWTSTARETAVPEAASEAGSEADPEAEPQLEAAHG